MNKEVRKSDQDMLDEYDFSQGEQGKYAKDYAEGTNTILLSPELAQVFPDSESVNQALHLLVDLAKRIRVSSPDIPKP
ncbi:MAG: hypothetical protein HQK58_15510 [Deltaproteobacteria bacterium]|nr:hypothetical protein [Deltaproteobacteria bacterium]MBF0525309.1 hypothetical protein [Deltaproteobacteria bacterium]